MYYIHQDHIGSYDVITTDNKAVSERHHFDPWGNRRNPTNWLATDTRTSFLFDRGFTGHEHLDAFKIINMNARLYDPVIGRFFSPDPYVQTPEFTQGFNRYSYCLNNPLRYVDPSGKITNPIFNYFGDLLGTDDKGIQGRAIIMRPEVFKQGMSHDEAMRKGRTLDNTFVLSQNLIDKINKQLQTFPTRPDWDGYLTKDEADAWWLGKSGQPLFLDQSKIELPGITTKSFKNKEGSYFYKNFIWTLNNTGKVYGTLKLTLTDATKGYVHIGGKNYLDEYDFTMDDRPLRNFATWLGRPGGENDGENFFIYGYGQATIPVK